MRKSLDKKLIGSFMIIAVLSGIASAVLYEYLDRVQQSYSNLLGNQVRLKAVADNIKYNAALQNSILNTLLLTGDSYQGDTLIQANREIDALIAEAMQIMAQLGQKNDLNYIGSLNQSYYQRAQAVFESLTDDPQGVIEEANRGVIPLGGTIINYAEQLAQKQDQAVTEQTAANRRLVARIRWLAVATSAANMALAIAIGYAFSRSLSRSLIRLAAAAREIASGNLGIGRIQLRRHDELGSLAASFDEMKERLLELVRRISRNANEVAAMSGDLTLSTQQTGAAADNITGIMSRLSGHVEKQVGSVEAGREEVAAIASAIRNIADKGRQASELSLEASNRAAEGDREIRGLTRQMDEIERRIDRLKDSLLDMKTRTEEIASVNGLISGIAAQTNVLALNAAIEAARAGAAGRGFAVVADEIRKLSLQSDESARNVAELAGSLQEATTEVMDSLAVAVREVSMGTGIAHRAGAAFDGIRQLVEEASSRVAQVSASAERLSAGTEGIVGSMENIYAQSSEISAGTQTVASAAEEQLAALLEISSFTSKVQAMVEELQAAVDRFQLPLGDLGEQAG